MRETVWGLPGNTKRHHWSFGDCGHKLPYIFQPSQKKAHLSPTSRDSDSPPFQPSVTGHRGWLNQDTNSPKLKRHNSASHCDHNALEFSGAHRKNHELKVDTKVLFFIGILPRKYDKKLVNRSFPHGFFQYFFQQVGDKNHIRLEWCETVLYWKIRIQKPVWSCNLRLGFRKHWFQWILDV